MTWSLEEVEKCLVSKGWPATSPWWLGVYAKTRSTRNIVVRGGRRGGKSSTVCRIAVSEVLNEAHVVPDGDVGWFAIVSATKEQAKDRLQNCGKILSALGIEHKQTAETITLADRPTGIRCFAGTLKAAVSFTSIGALCDEVARWQDENGANPAEEILSSLRPTAATMPHAQFWLVSSPWSVLDLHHKMVEAGDGVAQKVFVGTSWEMNPTLTEAYCRTLEPDEQTFLREYAAVPMSSDERTFFPAIFVEDAFSLALGGSASRVVAGGDFAFVKNSSAMVAIADLGDGTYRGESFEERIPGSTALVPSKTIRELVRIAAEHGADSISCDGHYRESVREHISDLPIELMDYPPNINAESYVRLRVLLSERKIDLSRAPQKLLSQLKNTTATPTASGLTIKNKTVAGAHGDLVSALVCAVWALDQENVGDEERTTGARRYGRSNDANEPGKLNDLPTAEDMN